LALIGINESNNGFTDQICDLGHRHYYLRCVSDNPVCMCLLVPAG